jgi:ParB family chromosome partitioning protein
MPDQKPHSRLDQFTAKYEPLDDYQEGAFQKIPIAKIGANPFQPRRYFDQEGLLELAQSIKDKGVLQPVIVRRRQDGSVHLVAGERRLRAAKIAGLEEIPCVLTRGNPDEIALIENLQRENLKPIEEAEALAQMMDQHHYTQETLAEIIGKSKSLVSETLSLNQLPGKIKDQCRQSDACPRQLLIEIARQKTPKAMLALFSQAKRAGLKSPDVKDTARKRRVPSIPSEDTERAPLALAAAKTRELKDLLQELPLKEQEQTQDKADLLTHLQELQDLISKILHP